MKTSGVAIAILGLGLISLFSETVQAGQFTLVCSKSAGKSQQIVSVHFSAPNFDVDNATYEYESIWQGAFPTDDRDSGPAVGTSRQLADGKIDANYSFTAFHAATRLVVNESVGTLTIGGTDPTSITDLSCEMK